MSEEENKIELEEADIDTTVTEEYSAKDIQVLLSSNQRDILHDYEDKIFAFVSSPMSLWSFSALLTVATETPQILEMSFNDAIPFSCFMSSSFHPTCFVT